MKFCIEERGINSNIFCHWQELEQIESIWELNLDWEKHWEGWKYCQFTELETKEMEELSNNNYRKLNKMSRELKVSSD